MSELSVAFVYVKNPTSEPVHFSLAKLAEDNNVFRPESDDNRWWTGDGWFMVESEPNSDLLQASYGHTVYNKEASGVFRSGNDSDPPGAFEFEHTVHGISYMTRGCSVRCGMYKEISAGTNLHSPFASTIAFTGDETRDAKFKHKLSTVARPQPFALGHGAVNGKTIPPFSTDSLGPIYFRPPGDKAYNASVFVRNSITMLEEVKIFGLGILDHVDFLADKEETPGEITEISNLDTDNGVPKLSFDHWGDSVTRGLVLSNSGSDTAFISNVYMVSVSGGPGPPTNNNHHDSDREVCSVNGFSLGGYDCGARFALPKNETRRFSISHEPQCTHSSSWSKVVFEFSSEEVIAGKKVEVLVGYDMSPDWSSRKNCSPPHPPVYIYGLVVGIAIGWVALLSITKKSYQINLSPRNVEKFEIISDVVSKEGINDGHCLREIAGTFTRRGLIWLYKSKQLKTKWFDNSGVAKNCGVFKNLDRENGSDLWGGVFFGKFMVKGIGGGCGLNWRLSDEQNILGDPLCGEAEASLLRSRSKLPSDDDTFTFGSKLLNIGEPLTEQLEARAAAGHEERSTPSVFDDGFVPSFDGSAASDGKLDRAIAAAKRQEELLKRKEGKRRAAEEERIRALRKQQERVRITYEQKMREREQEREQERVEKEKERQRLNDERLKEQLARDARIQEQQRKLDRCIQVKKQSNSSSTKNNNALNNEEDPEILEQRKLILAEQRKEKEEREKHAKMQMLWRKQQKEREEAATREKALALEKEAELMRIEKEKEEDARRREEKERAEEEKRREAARQRIQAEKERQQKAKLERERQAKEELEEKRREARLKIQAEKDRQQKVRAERELKQKLEQQEKKNHQVTIETGKLRQTKNQRHREQLQQHFVSQFQERQQFVGQKQMQKQEPPPLSSNAIGVVGSAVKTNIGSSSQSSQKVATATLKPQIAPPPGMGGLHLMGGGASAPTANGSDADELKVGGDLLGEDIYGSGFSLDMVGGTEIAQIGGVVAFGNSSLGGPSALLSRQNSSMSDSSNDNNNQDFFLPSDILGGFEEDDDDTAGGGGGGGGGGLGTGSHNPFISKQSSSFGFGGESPSGDQQHGHFQQQQQQVSLGSFFSDLYSANDGKEGEGDLLSPQLLGNPNNSNNNEDVYAENSSFFGS